MIKRIIDIVGSGVGLLLLSPLFLLVALTIRLILGPHVLFWQLRPGRNDKLFYMVKFRTMHDAYDSNGNLLPDAERLTHLGRLLRSSSLDELPELWNVLKGEMSLVGPRPLLVEYLGLYTTEQARRHEVRPGITGWAQINGRNAITWDEKFSHDVWYVDNHNLWLDLKIILLTILKVIKREGVSASGEATAPRFKG